MSAAALKPSSVLWQLMVIRVAVVLSFAWALSICGIAVYEWNTVDPWKFIGEDRGAMFFTWSRQLVYRTSSFGEVVLVLDAPRFWTTLLVPIVALIAGASVAPLIARTVHHSAAPR